MLCFLLTVPIVYPSAANADTATLAPAPAKPKDPATILMYAPRASGDSKKLKLYSYRSLVEENFKQSPLPLCVHVCRRERKHFYLRNTLLPPVPQHLQGEEQEVP